MALTKPLSLFFITCVELTRLNRPTGILLLLWPCWWAIALASEHLLQQMHLLMLFLIGAILMRSAGCIINDFVDRHIDAKVQRTQNRPLASGKIKPTAALILLLALIVLAFMVAFKLNALTLKLGLLFSVLVVAYPFAKRFINAPQIILALVFNAGALMGWSAVQNTVSSAAIALYFACFFWTLIYDTIYAHQDIQDDIKIGVKSLAITLGNKNKLFMSSCVTMMCIMLVIAGYISNIHWAYYVGISIASTHLFWQVHASNLQSPQHCAVQFKRMAHTGPLIIASIWISKLFA